MRHRLDRSGLYCTRFNKFKNLGRVGVGYGRASRDHELDEGEGGDRLKSGGYESRD